MFLIIINAENIVLLNIFVETVIYFSGFFLIKRKFKRTAFN